GVTSELGTVWAEQAHTFEKLQGSIATQWFPQASGDDYKLLGTLRGGKTFGALPFDELPVLGIERDTDLWMRAHVGTRDGIKGSAPLGRNYLLLNWEMDKNV